MNDAIEGDGLHFHGELHITDAEDLEAFLIRHDELVLKMMGWKK